MEQVVESNLRMRRNREFLWVSRECKTIYLKAHESCLTLYFPVYEDLFVYMTTLIFWMMTEGKMQRFLKKHFMRKRIWIHRCMYSRKIIILLLLMKSIQNFWQKYWLIQRCGRCSIRWRRR